MPETTTRRVVAVCGAVSRKGVSSLSCATCFEVLRDSQILGSESSGSECTKKTLKNNQTCFERRENSENHGMATARVRHQRLPSRFLCSDGWVAHAAGKKTRRANLEQLASACQRIVSRRHNQPRKLRRVEKSMRFTGDTACSQHHKYGKGHRDKNEQTPKTTPKNREIAMDMHA